MANIPDFTGPRTPQETPSKPDKAKLKRSESLISSQRVKREEIQKKPEQQVGKENFAPTRQSETIEAVAKANFRDGKKCQIIDQCIWNYPGTAWQKKSERRCCGHETDGGNWKKR